jgi:hypothetical protein
VREALTRRAALKELERLGKTILVELALAALGDHLVAAFRQSRPL